jgi:RecJ-like exonuclease
MGKGCPVCKGSGTISLLDCPCSFCNGTGEYTKSAESYYNSHICQCVLLDRKQCPLCGKKCHHDTPNKPKIRLSPQ